MLSGSLGTGPRCGPGPVYSLPGAWPLGQLNSSLSQGQRVLPGMPPHLRPWQGALVRRGDTKAAAITNLVCSWLSVGRLSWRLGPVSALQFPNGPHGVLREASVAFELLGPLSSSSGKGSFRRRERRLSLPLSWALLGLLQGSQVSRPGQ